MPVLQKDTSILREAFQIKINLKLWKSQHFKMKTVIKDFQMHICWGLIQMLLQYEKIQSIELKMKKFDLKML